MGLGLDVMYSAIAVAASPVWGYRLLRTGKWRTDWPARFGRCPAIANGQQDPSRCLLIHAVSLGEVNSIRLLVEKLRDADPRLRIIVSSTTDTGIARARDLFEPQHKVVRYPLDLTRCVRKFLDAVDPTVVALVELELWPNFTQQCQRRNIGVCVINGRLSVHSYSRYRIMAPFIRSMFARLDIAAVQSQAYAQRFAEMGTASDRVKVLDTMKWDTAQLTDNVDGADELATAMGIDRLRPVVVAGSTAPGEEQLLIETCPTDAQLVLVPRRPERFDQVAQLDRHIVRRTEHPDGTVRPLDDQRLFLIDTVGELKKTYVLATIALVGRSFLGMFGSDMIEPIALGKPTITGPFHSNFEDTMAALRSGSGIEVTDRPGPLVEQLLADPHRAAQLAQRGRQVIKSRQGSTDRHVELLLNLLDASWIGAPSV